MITVGLVLAAIGPAAGVILAQADALSAGHRMVAIYADAAGMKVDTERALREKFRAALEMAWRMA